MSENTDVSVDDLAPTILFGTFREDNAEWIAEKKLYNLPLPTGYHYDQYKCFTHIILFWGKDASPIAFTAKVTGVQNKQCLKTNGYSTDKSSHGDEYVIFSLVRKDGAYISVSDLKKYGRFDVVFYKQDGENYVMDFSKP